MMAENWDCSAMESRNRMKMEKKMPICHFFGRFQKSDLAERPLFQKLLSWFDISKTIFFFWKKETVNERNVNFLLRGSEGIYRIPN